MRVANQSFRFWFLLFLIVTIPSAWGWEQYSLKEGLSCVACHYNPAGGGSLNIRGRYYGRNNYSIDGYDAYINSLRKRLEEIKSEKKGVVPEVLETALEKMNLQGSFRTWYQYTVDRAEITSLDNFYLEEAKLVLSLDLHERLTFVYGSELNNLLTSDAFVVAKFPDFYGAFLKIGQFETPFGFHIDDHTSLVRSLYGLQHYLRDTGVTAGFEHGGFFTNLSILNAFRHFSPATDTIRSIGDPNQGLGVSLNLGYQGTIWDANFFMGGSFLREETGHFRGAPEREELLWAFYLALNYWRVTLLGEVDWGRDKGIGIGVGGLANPTTGLVDESPLPVFVGSTADFVAPYNGIISPNFGKQSLGWVLRGSMDIIPKKWAASLQWDLLTPNSKFAGDGPQRVKFATKVTIVKNLYIEPTYMFNTSPINASVLARNRNKDEFFIFAHATF